jgi:CheY-like chemotaxis protein
VREALQALVIDDEPQVSGFIAKILASDNWNVTEAESAEQAFELLPKERWALVFCDVVLGGVNGYEVLRHFSEKLPGASFVLMTGHVSAAGALDATALGAYDYLIKPFTVDDILRISQTVREQNLVHRQPDASDFEETAQGYTSDIPLIGKSPKFVECLKLVGRVAATNLPVLIVGESGTGKEVGRPRDSSAQQPGCQSVCRRQLRRDSCRINRIGIIRSRERLVYRSGARAPRFVGRSRRRHNFSGRNYRNQHAVLGETITRFAGRRDSARRSESNAEG